MITPPLRQGVVPLSFVRPAGFALEASRRARRLWQSIFLSVARCSTAARIRAAVAPHLRLRFASVNPQKGESDDSGPMRRAFPLTGRVVGAGRGAGQEMGLKPLVENAGAEGELGQVEIAAEIHLDDHGTRRRDGD